MVPITSDLIGYQEFWIRVVIVLLAMFGVFAITLIVLLSEILRRMPRKRSSGHGLNGVPQCRDVTMGQNAEVAG